MSCNPANNSYKRQQRTRFRVARNDEYENVDLVSHQRQFLALPASFGEEPPTYPFGRAFTWRKPLSCGMLDLALKSLGKIQRVGH